MMRHGVANDLHATASTADEVSWRHVRQQVLTAEELGFDLVAIGRTFDVGVDPLDIHGARTRSIETLQHLAGLGADEVRCYAVSDGTHAARLEAIEAVGA